jgi:hypothetical protein
MLDFMFDPEYWKKQALTAEANATVDVVSGQKTVDEALTDYGTSYISGNLLESGTDALNGATDNVDAVTQQFAENGQVNPALKSQPVAPPTPEQQVAAPEITGPVNKTFPNDSSLSNQANIKIGNDVIPGPQFESYPTTSPANLPEPEAPGTFLGLEGKDYTKMGMQGVMAAGVGALKPTPQVQSAAPAGPGITKGTVMQPQGGMQGVNSMVAPDPRLNSMQMTQAQGLISPFQRDRMRRGY